MKIFARMLLCIYVPLVVVAVVFAFIDTPTGRGWEGVVGLIAAYVAGLPWSLLVGGLHASTGFANRFGSNEDAVLMWLALACSLVNLRLLAGAAFPLSPDKSLELTREG